MINHMIKMYNPNEQLSIRIPKFDLYIVEAKIKTLKDKLSYLETVACREFTPEADRRELVKETTASFRAALKERDELMLQRDFLYD